MSHSLDEVTPLRWRAAATDDLAEVYGLLCAIAAFDDTTQPWAPTDLPDWYAAMGDRAHDLMVLGYEGASMVAVGWDVVGEAPGTVRLDGAVHPAFRHQGIGRQLLAWQLRRARAWCLCEPGDRPLRLLGFSDASMTNKRSLFAHQGLAASRWLIDMLCPFPASPRVAEIVLTPVLGVQFRNLSDAWIEPTRQAHNEAFADRWGARAVPPAEWAASMTAEHVRPELSWIAVDEWDTVVGYALNSATDIPRGPHIGWTDRLGVRPGQRGRNIARVLLARTLESFRRAGMDAGGLGLDSVDGGGLTLYRSLGYEATDTIIEFERRETRDEARAALSG